MPIQIRPSRSWAIAVVTECGKPSAREHYPFCSARCKDIDLNRWLKGAYVIPGRDGEEEEDDVPKPSPSPKDED